MRTTELELAKRWESMLREKWRRTGRGERGRGERGRGGVEERRGDLWYDEFEIEGEKTKTEGRRRKGTADLEWSQLRKKKWRGEGKGGGSEMERRLSSLRNRKYINASKRISVFFLENSRLLGIYFSLAGTDWINKFDNPYRTQLPLHSYSDRINTLGLRESQGRVIGDLCIIYVCFHY